MYRKLAQQDSVKVLLSNQPASVADQPASVPDQPASVADQPASVADQPASVGCVANVPVRKLICNKNNRVHWQSIPH